MFDLNKKSPYATYLEFCGRGELPYQVSRSTGAAIAYPHVIAPTSGEDDLEWRVSKGQGEIYAVTIVRNRDAPPHNVVLVDLDEGFRIMSTVEGATPEAVRIGMRVSMRMKPGTEKDAPYPVFVPADQ